MNTCMDTFLSRQLNTNLKKITFFQVNWNTITYSSLIICKDLQENPLSLSKHGMQFISSATDSLYCHIIYCSGCVMEKQELLVKKQI